MNADRDGDALTAEHLAGEAHRADPEFALAAELLGWFALDRGDLARARRLLSAGGVDLSDVIDDVASQVAAVGRNEPCPCGSGRKFKACCQGRVGVASHRRAALVYGRLGPFAAKEPFLSRSADLAMIAIARAGDVERVVNSGFVLDLVFFEGGVAQEYLDRRGVLLTDEDRDLLEAAIGAPRRLWEVVGSESGTSVSLRDTGSNDLATVAERRGSHARRVGEYVIGRVVPVADELQLIGAVITIDMRHREAVMTLIDDAAGAHDWADWYGAAMAPPEIVLGEIREGGQTEFDTVEELLEHETRAYEDRWLDMDIPALGGATPRQAADDPTLREDLSRLLDSVPEVDGPGGMDAARLRRLLGI